MTTTTIAAGRLRLPGRNSKRFLVLALSALWAPATTYLVFVVYVRVLTPAAVGTLALATAVSTMGAQLADGGQGLKAVRDALGSDQPSAVLGLALRRRLAQAAALCVASFLLLRVAFSVDVATALLAGFCVIVGSLYAFILYVEQAKFRYRRIAMLQMANGVAFLAFLGLMTATPAGRTVPGALCIPAGAFLTLTVIFGYPHRQLLVRGTGRAETLRDGHHFASLAIANIIASSSDSLILGAFSRPTLAVYAAAQRPAMAVSSMSSALTTLALPELSHLDRKQRRQIIHRSTWAATGAPVVFAGGFAIGLWVMPLIYSDTAVLSPMTMGLLLTAYFLGMLTITSSTALLLDKRVHLVNYASILQVIIMLPILLVAGILQSSILAAGAILASRSVALLVLTRSARQLHNVAIGGRS